MPDVRTRTGYNMEMHACTVLLISTEYKECEAVEGSVMETA